MEKLNLPGQEKIQKLMNDYFNYSDKTGGLEWTEEDEVDENKKGEFYVSPEELAKDELKQLKKFKNIKHNIQRIDEISKTRLLKDDEIEFVTNNVGYAYFHCNEEDKDYFAQLASEFTREKADKMKWINHKRRKLIDLSIKHLTKDSEKLCNLTLEELNTIIKILER